MNDKQRSEQLKDRRDYRATLIQRREETDAKIKTTEGQIKILNESR